jgi:hypothetical protein
LRIDNLQMDMTGVELLVANAHQQIQCVEDEVITPFINGHYLAQQDHRILEEALRDRVNNLELAKDQTDKKCESVQEVLTSWMVTFEVLETSVGSVTTRAQTLEDNQEWLASHSAAMTEMSRGIREFQEMVLDQATTIKLLQECVGELELSHGVLQARVIHIEVRTSMVA